MKRLVVFFLLSILAGTCVFSQSFIHVNQVGYYADGTKTAMLTDLEADEFYVRSAANDEIVFGGEVSLGKRWNLSGEYIQFADFSEFCREGEFYLQVGEEKSCTFRIGKSLVYDSLVVAVLKSFYFLRASVEIEPKYSSFRNFNFSRAEGHPDTLVFVHRGVSHEERHVGYEISSPKGWYDGTDYNKYVVNAGFSLHSLSLAYEMFPVYFDSLNLNIPESGNDVPDILDEIKWELDWLMTMQDPFDGGVYFKLTTQKFSELIMPHEDVADRFVVGKSTSSALNFAAAMTIASRLFSRYDSIYPGFSKKTLDAALKAYSWAEKNPSVPFSNPSDIFTGDYKDDDMSDEFFWVAAELFVTTKDRKYYDKLDFFQKFTTPSWDNTNALGLISLIVNIDRLPDFADKSFLMRKMKSMADILQKQYLYSPGRVPLKKFEWGSNGAVAMNGVVLGVAYSLYKEKKYLDGAVSCFDYLLGRNSTGYSFVSGFGKKYPVNLHDRRSFADGIPEPIPGYLVGGPNPNQIMDCGKMNYPTIMFPARMYLDEVCSFSTNEISIIWNAPFVWLATIIENCCKSK